MSNYKHTQLNNRMTMQNRPGLSARSGFTLTEMLVAVGLLLVIMLIFSQIFSLAVTAMTRQKGLANNDQRARTAFTVLDADLKRMSYRSVPGQGGIVPLVPGLRYNGEASATEQQGYIYYSENDPNLDTDDVLQFTVDASVTGKYPGAQRYAGQNVLPYYGRGLSLRSPSPPSLPLSVLRDQPDWDDGTPGDNVGSSEQAEVAYFLRNGTLYRRVCLLRNNKVGVPINMAEFDQGNQTALAQPAFRFPTPINDGGVDKYFPYDLMRNYSGNFYNDFDYSAHHTLSPYDSVISSIYSTASPPTSGRFLAVFHGSLSNSSEDNWPLGVPHFRFGFNNDYNTNNNMRGRPREYISGAEGIAFAGRYTHEETSNPTFLYPHSLGGNVFAKNNFDISAFRATGRMPSFSGGPRRGADILMSNVHSFDVQIWDAFAFNGNGGFVNIGDGNSFDFQPASRLNGADDGYGSIDGISDSAPISPNGKNVFDTWHSVPNVHLKWAHLSPPLPAPNDEFPIIGTDMPPFMPQNVYATGANAPLSLAPQFKNKQRWTQAMTITPGMIVFAPPQTTNETTPANVPYRDAIYWVADFRNTLSATTSYTYPSGSPTMPFLPDVDVIGTEIIDPNEPSGDLVWIANDNRRSIKALRIIIRFIDPLSRQLRQVTMVHSFNEDAN